MVGPKPRVLITTPLTVAHRTNPEHNTAFSNADRLCDTLAWGNGGFKSLNGKRMSCKNEPYRHERKERTVPGVPLKGLNSSAALQSEHANC
jgi:hypothetical protein